MTTAEKKAAFVSYLGSKRAELEFLNYIEVLFNVGYQTDQAQIAADVQAGKDAYAKEVQGLYDTIHQSELNLAALQEEKNEKESEIIVLKQKETKNIDIINNLQSQITDKDTQIIDLKNRITELEAQINGE